MSLCMSLCIIVLCDPDLYHRTHYEWGENSRSCLFKHQILYCLESFNDKENNNDDAEDYNLALEVEDLLIFSYQVAKGMSFLSSKNVRLNLLVKDNFRCIIIDNIVSKS